MSDDIGKMTVKLELSGEALRVMADRLVEDVAAPSMHLSPGDYAVSFAVHRLAGVLREVADISEEPLDPGY